MFFISTSTASISLDISNQAAGFGHLLTSVVIFLVYLAQTFTFSQVVSGSPSLLPFTIISDFFVQSMMIIGGLLSLIGLIGGVILGLWRVGARYSSTAIKIGAIFTFFPLLNCVSMVLVIIDARHAKERSDAVQCAPT